MPEPVISPTAAPVVATTSPNGIETDGFFGPQMEEALTEAFAKARPEEFKPKTSTRSASPSAPMEAEKPAEQPISKSEQEKPTETKQPVKAAQWKEVNEERARLKEENAKFKADLDKYTKEQEKWKSWETERNEFETIKKHNTELLDRMQQIAVEKDPRFENYFKAKTDTAIALAKQAVGDTHAERISKLLQLPDSEFRTQALDEIRNELSGTRAGRLDAAIVRMDEINLERSAAISKSKENWEAMQKADRDKHQNQRQQFERTFQDTLQKWSDPEKGLALFQKKDGDEAHNAEVEKRVETARNILNLNLGADQLAKAALWSAAAPGLLQNQLALAKENAALKEELEALKAGGPDLQGGGGEQSVDEDKMYEGMDAGAIIADKVKKAGGWS